MTENKFKIKYINYLILKLENQYFLVFVFLSNFTLNNIYQNTYKCNERKLNEKKNYSHFSLTITKK